jgi:hypothetical protein
MPELAERRSHSPVSPSLATLTLRATPSISSKSFDLAVTVDAHDSACRSRAKVPTPRMQEQFSCCCGEDASSAELYEHLHDPLECLATVRLAGAVYTRRTSEIDKTDSRETIKRSMRKRKNDAQTITWRTFKARLSLCFTTRRVLRLRN